MTDPAPRRRRGGPLALVAAVAVLAAGGGHALAPRQHTEAVAAPSPLTAVVERGDLVDELVVPTVDPAGQVTSGPDRAVVP